MGNGRWDNAHLVVTTLQCMRKKCSLRRSAHYISLVIGTLYRQGYYYLMRTITASPFITYHSVSLNSLLYKTWKKHLQGTFTTHYNLWCCFQCTALIWINGLGLALNMAEVFSFKIASTHSAGDWWSDLCKVVNSEGSTKMCTINIFNTTKTIFLQYKKYITFNTKR